MSDLSEIRTQIQSVRARLSAALTTEALRAGADVAALVENRIVTTGRKSDGGTLSPYSEKQAPAFFYFGRSRNNAGEQAVRQRAKQRKGVSYKEFRALNGLNVANKNLEFTGEMWQGFGVTAVREIQPGLYRVTVGGKNSRSDALLGYHSQRERTDVTEPSKKEIDQVKAALAERLEKILRNV